MFLIIVSRLCRLLWLCLLLSACARQPLAADRPVSPALPARGAQLHGRLVEMQTQRIVSIDAFVARAQQVQLVAVGEEHDHPDIQAFELQLLQSLARHSQDRLALAMEFLERDMQPFLDAYLAGSSDAATLQQHIKATPSFMQYYFPLLAYARQAGIPVLAMNLPRRLARQVARQGLQPVLADLTAAERAYLPDTLLPITSQYRTYFQQAVARAHPLPAEQAEQLLEAAHLKDATMADTLSAFLQENRPRTILAIAGRFHFDYGLAIPAQLQQRLPTVSIRRLTTMSVEADEPVDLPQLAQAGLADYVWFAPPHPASGAGT